MWQRIQIKRTSPLNVYQVKNIARSVAQNGVPHSIDRVLAFNSADYNAIVYAITEAGVHWRHIQRTI